jgi:hypothetical protein
MVRASLGKKQDAVSKITKSKRARVVKGLPSMQEALSSIPSHQNTTVLF